MSKNYFNEVSLIRKKRDGLSLSTDEIKYLIDKYTKDELPDYQMSAFLMACFHKGLNEEETSALTHAMLHSGIVIDTADLWEDKSIKNIDKHSTGGVGDKLSLILAPIVAAAGVPVPMISGRGLGHTGGTLDKLESIPGFDVNVDLDRYKDILKRHNLVFAGQTEDIAPADKRLYALRDVTATVECIPLIAGSIMSKKLAEGIDGLVLDVKHGSGAFIKDVDEAKILAQTLCSIGWSFKKEVTAFLTSMDQPLGNEIGNWLEVKESIDCLRGKWPADVREVTLLLSGAMIQMGGKASSLNEGIEISLEMIENGEALDKLREIVIEQDGDVSVIDDPDSYPQTKYSREFKIGGDGYITGINAYLVGMASLELGAGRKEKSQAVDHQAGITLHRKVGEPVKKGETIATLYTNNEKQFEQAESLLKDAFDTGAKKPETKPMITHMIDSKGLRAFDYGEVPSLK